MKIRGKIKKESAKIQKNQHIYLLTTTFFYSQPIKYQIEKNKFQNNRDKFADVKEYLINLPFDNSEIIFDNILLKSQILLFL